MATETVIDPETMSMEDLRKAAEEEARKASTNSADDTAQVDDPAETDPPTDDDVVTSKGPFYSERTIDLGDGAGVQVFKGKGDTREAALEDLTDKLAEAQRNATKKIRELNAKAKVETPKTSPEDEALYSAELLKTPTEAFKKLFKQVTGVDVEEFKTVTAREKAFQAGQEKKSAADSFVANTPDYVDTPRNGKLINKWCELHNDFSLNGLTKAYQDLSESGLLDTKGEEASGEQGKDKSATGIPPKTDVTPSQRTRKGSGLSTHRSTPAARTAEPTEDDMYSMPLEELRKKANQQLAGR